MMGLVKRSGKRTVCGIVSSRNRKPPCGKSSCGNGFVPCGGFCVSTRIGPFVNYPGYGHRWRRRGVVVGEDASAADRDPQGAEIGGRHIRETDGFLPNARVSVKAPAKVE